MVRAPCVRAPSILPPGSHSASLTVAPGSRFAVSQSSAASTAPITPDQSLTPVARLLRGGDWVRNWVHETTGLLELSASTSPPGVADCVVRPALPVPAPSSSAGVRASASVATCGLDPEPAVDVRLGPVRMPSSVVTCAGRVLERAGTVSIPAPSLRPVRPSSAVGEAEPAPPPVALVSCQDDCLWRNGVRLRTRTAAEAGSASPGPLRQVAGCTAWLPLQVDTDGGAAQSSLLRPRSLWVVGIRAGPSSESESSTTTSTPSPGAFGISAPRRGTRATSAQSALAPAATRDLDRRWPWRFAAHGWRSLHIRGSGTTEPSSSSATPVLSGPAGVAGPEPTRRLPGAGRSLPPARPP
mmetsp:Transcript_6391/g.15537  ORF Transcript_6391/g.15537 Transcript_6391/m.15537 type:complete len:355 (+) Transcript_6391:38-1102(+)